MAKFSSQYKQTGPTRRIISGENTYEKGMHFSEHPLPAGAVHTLLNLNIDSIDYSLSVSGGLHTTDIAAGCNFLDRAVFNAASNQVIVLQGRNEYCARAFEGITNILSVQKLSVKNNQTLAEEIRQQGFTANDVVCYKLLTYNPINHRLMSVTLLQASRDKYFTVSKDYKLRRLQVNPISCGFSEVWNTPDGGTYISNITDYHTGGAKDYFIPRTRRNNFNETFGQELHSPHYMQTLAHCEGYGNKTFCFLHKKQTEIEGALSKDYNGTRIPTYSLQSFTLGEASGFIEGDLLTIHPIEKPPDTLKSFEQIVRYHIGAVDTTGKILDGQFLSNGVFEWTGVLPQQWAVNLTRFDPGPTVYFGELIPTSISYSSVMVYDSARVDTQYDIYLRNCNTGSDTNLNSEAVLNGLPVPVDAYRFGIVMTSVFLGYTAIDQAPPVIDPLDLYNTALLDPIKAAGKSDYYEQEHPTLEVDLNNGLIRAIKSTSVGVVTFRTLPVIRGTEAVNSITGAGGLFESNTVFLKITDFQWKHPAENISSAIKDTVRIGQGFRIAVFAKSAVPLTRSLNMLREDPLTSEYYNGQPEAVYILDYVWNGATWDFSFLDTRKLPDATNPTFVENWETNQNIVDAVGNKIIRHYVWNNRLAYLDVITEDNQDNMAQHLVDYETAPYLIYNTATETLIGSDNIGPLTYNIAETLDAYIGGNVLDNKSKLFDTSYGHFDVAPRELTPSEAARWGFNMLSPTPYLFKCQNTSGLAPLLTGCTLMKNGLPLLKPLINTNGTLYVYFNSDQTYISSMDPQGYQLTLEYKNQFDEWRVLKEFSVADTHAGLASGVPFQIPFTSPDETVLIKMQLLDRNQKVEVGLTDGTVEEHFLPVSVIIHTLSYTKDPTQTETAPLVYDLGSALGMTYWKSRLVAWGVLGAENQIFMSEASQPEYWPYPNNIEIFEENIIHIMPYSDSLIVFTSTKLWRLDMLSNGLSWQKTLIQQNLRITDKDIPYICVLKNMLFFKSDKQFYMLVPQRGTTIGDVTIAPVSKPIQNFLLDPFESIKRILPSTCKEMLDNEKPINEYLVKYGTHIEQMRVYVDWWFDLTAFKNQEAHIGEQEIQHDVHSPGENAQLLPKEYWLVQLVYDAQLYAWNLRTHTSNTIGVFISDAANANTDFISLVFTPELQINQKPIFVDPSGHTRYSKPTWGVSVAHRNTPEESLLQQFSLSPEQIITLESSYPRFQILDTGYKEVSTPALLKRFREAQLFVQPEDSKQVEAKAPSDWLQQLIEYDVPYVAETPSLVTPYMSSKPVDATTGDAVALKVLFDVYVDGHHILSSIRPEVRYEPSAGGVLQIKIIDTFTFIESPFTVNAELSNTFILDNSALTGVKLVRFRKTVNGKGQLIRMKFCNLTETSYALLGHAFVAHNKNAR